MTISLLWAADRSVEIIAWAVFIGFYSKTGLQSLLASNWLPVHWTVIRSIRIIFSVELQPTKTGQLIVRYLHGSFWGDIGHSF